MREKKYHIYLTAEEQSRVIQSLIRLKNELLEQGRYTDTVDDLKSANIKIVSSIFSFINSDFSFSATSQ